MGFITKEDIEELQTAFLAVYRTRMNLYKKNHESYFRIPTIDSIPADKNHLFYEDLAEDTKSVIGKEIKYTTLHKLMTPCKIGEKGKTFHNSNIEKIIKYSKWIRTDILEVKAERLNLQGSFIINEEYKKSLSQFSRRFTIEDYYLGKQTDEFQFFGISQKWDVDRDIYKTINNELNDAFIHRSIVSSVIYGDAGCGKSTLLRRLAYDNSEKYVCIWLTDLDKFYSNDIEVIKGNNTVNFLLFIEDWTWFERSKDFMSTFLQRLVNARNVRLIIGDREIKEKEYQKFVYGQNYYPLNNDENGKIIRLIASRNPQWFKHKIFDNDYSKTSLYVILFVAIRTHSDAKEIKIKTNDFISLFREIIALDLKRIHERFPGLAKAIYFYSCLSKDEYIPLAWKDLWILGDYFSSSNPREKPVTSAFIWGNNKETNFKLLTGLLSVKNIYSPVFDRFFRGITFHHDLLLEQLSIPPQEKYDFNTGSRIEVLKVLLRNNSVFTAFTMLVNMIEDETEGEKVFPNERVKEDLVSLMERNIYSDEYEIITTVQISPQKIKSEDGWRRVLLLIVDYYKDQNSLYTALETLSLFGAKSKLFESIFEVVKRANKKEFFSNKLLNELRQEVVERILLRKILLGRIKGI